MIRKSRSRDFAFLIGAAFLAALGACSSPDPVLYTIAPVSAAARSGGPKVILIEQVTIARYLDRSQIVTTSEDFRLNVKPNDWWGEPLGPMVRRVLQQELSQRLPQSIVLSESGGVSASPDATLDLDIQRLDEDGRGNLVLQAQAGFSFKGKKSPVVRAFNVAVPVPSADTKGEVTAISTAVGQLADGLATALIAR